MENKTIFIILLIIGALFLYQSEYFKGESFAILSPAVIPPKASNGECIGKQAIGFVGHTSCYQKEACVIEEICYPIIPITQFTVSQSNAGFLGRGNAIWTQNCGSVKWVSDGCKQVIPYPVYDDSIVHIQYSPNGGERAVHDIKFVSGNFFEPSVEYNYVTDNPYFYKDIEPKIVTIKLNSKYTQSLTDVKLFIWLEDTLNIAGKHIIDLSRNVNVNPGSNEYQIELPVGLEIQKYNLNYFFSIWHPNFIQGLQGTPPCTLGSDYNTLGQCGAIKLTEIQTESFIIAPKPLTLSKNPDQTCIEGYEPQVVGNLISDTVCVRNDLSELPCMVIGCPMTLDKTYLCSSSGMCVEEIYQATGCEMDTDCDEGQRCNIETGVCWSEVVYENIIQCSTSEDCSIPCSGITVDCVNNECVWEGECESILVNCNELGCPSGFVCQSDGVCVAEIVPVPLPDEPKDLFSFKTIGVIVGIAFMLYLIFAKK